jgi:hypothetical protein
MSRLEAQPPEPIPDRGARRSAGGWLWRALTYRTRRHVYWAVNNAILGLVLLVTGLQRPGHGVALGLFVGFLAILSAQQARLAVRQRRQRRAALSSSAPGAAPATPPVQTYAELQAAMRHLREQEEHPARLE